MSNGGSQPDPTGATPFTNRARPDVSSKKFVRRVASGFEARYRYTRNKKEGP